MTFTIYPARKIITLNPNRPEVDCVAIQDGRILGAGPREELAQWGEHRVDDRFREKVLVPGFVEGHCHLSQGTLWRFVYVGSYDRSDPDGRVWPGLRTIDAVIERLRAAADLAQDKSAPIVGWGFDPVSLPGTQCSRHDLDRVADTLPVILIHASIHMLSANSQALKAAGYFRTGIVHPGLPMAPDDLPSGEVRGPEAMGPVAELAGLNRAMLAADEPGVRAFGKLAVRAGVTTAADLANPLTEDVLDMLLRVTGEDRFPTRVVSMQRLAGMAPSDIVASALRLKERSTDQLRLGFIKLVLDGSVQGF